MIYLDSAATSFRKPAAVHQAVSEALGSLSSPGRGGYKSAMSAADVLYEARACAAELFGVGDPARVVFTMNATHGLNIAIKSLVPRGGRAVVSGYEHNAVVRPLHALDAEVCVAASPLFDPDAAIEAFRRLLPKADAAICTHISNVFGYILPIERIAVLCREYGVPLIVDASQSAGCLPLDFRALGCRFMAMPGHKGLLGPQGTGLLLCADETAETLMEGGTGSESADERMPAFLPDRLEAGTHNMPGIAGLLAGMRYIRERTVREIYRHETGLRRQMARRLSGTRGIRLFESEGVWQSGVLSLQITDMDCEEAAGRLGEQGIAVRAGLHCAPLAHRTAGTFGSGTVRLSFSPFNTERETELAAKAVRALAAVRN